MFKKRTNNNNKTQVSKLSINLLEQIGQIEVDNSNIINSSNNGQQIQQRHLNQKVQNPYQPNQIAEKPQASEEDQEYLQHLQRDKKLQALFTAIQNQQNLAPSKYQTKNSENYSSLIEEQTKPIIKNPIKVALPIPRKNNLYQAIASNQKNVSIGVQNQTKTLQNYTNKQKEPKGKEMQDLFKQIAQQHKKQEQEVIKNSLHQNIKPQTTAKPTIRPNQFIIQDDEYVEQIPRNQFLYKQPNIDQPSTMRVEVDYQGNLSPQVSEIDIDDNFHEQDFQDELIRKTLTRRNYLKLQENNNLKQTKLTQKKDKLLNTILKTSWHQIDAKISSDINSKVTKRNQLQQEMKYLEDRLQQRSEEVDRKKMTLQQLKAQHKRIKKVIYFICYFGDQLLKPGESIQSFFEDLTSNIISKIQKLADKVGIEEFMEKKRTREELRDKYRSGRKKIKANTEDQDQEAIPEQQADQDDDDGECYIEDDDY